MCSTHTLLLYFNTSTWCYKRKTISYFWGTKIPQLLKFAFREKGSFSSDVAPIFSRIFLNSNFDRNNIPPSKRQILMHGQIQVDINLISVIKRFSIYRQLCTSSTSNGTSCWVGFANSSHQQGGKIKFNRGSSNKQCHHDPHTKIILSDICRDVAESNWFVGGCSWPLS